MKTLMISAMAALVMAAPVFAQTVPDLKGTWSGQWKTVIYGVNPHHPAAQLPPMRPAFVRYGSHWRLRARMDASLGQILAEPRSQGAIRRDNDGGRQDDHRR
jgi:hypothetical protein